MTTKSRCPSPEVEWCRDALVLVRHHLEGKLVKIRQPRIPIGRILFEFDVLRLFHRVDALLAFAAFLLDFLHASDVLPPAFAKAVWEIYLGNKNVGEAVKKALVARLD